MTIYLPTKPLPKSATPSPIVFGGWQTPPTGGVESWLAFMGGRMQVAFQTPNLVPEPDGRLWTGALLEGWTTGETVACVVPQPGLRSKIAHSRNGAIVVDGAGQAGTTLNLRGLTPGSASIRRQFFSLVHGGRRYLHWVRAEAKADDAGRMVLPIGPMLRVSPADGDVCEFGAPMIEGKLTGDDKGWTMIPARIQGLNFTIAEIA